MAGQIAKGGKNPPLFPVPGGGQSPVPGRPQETEPLRGPGEAVSNVDGQGNFVGGTGHAFDGKDQFGVNPGHGAPLVDADFGGTKTFVKSTAKHLEG